MADTTPTKSSTPIINSLSGVDPTKGELMINETPETAVARLEAEIEKRQIALVRIYRIFDETMHPCKFELNAEGRMAWMRKLAQEASTIKVLLPHPLDQIAMQKAAQQNKGKIIGVGIAGEKSKPKK